MPEVLDANDRVLARHLDMTIARYSRTIRRAIRRSGEHDQLTDRELRCLQLVAERGPVLTSEIARRVGVAVSNITHTLDELSNRGLVTRQARPEAGNRIHAAITANGTKVLDHYEAMAHDRLCRAISRLTNEQKSRLEQAVADLAAVLGPGAARP